MNIRTSFTAITLVLFAFVADAQYVLSGTIKFERKINLPKQSEEEAFQRQLREKNLQFKTDFFSLHFDERQSLYIPVESDLRSTFVVPGLMNSVSYDLTKKIRRSKKTVFGQDFYVIDTASGISWKYTGEIREIAGYACKRAEAIIFDSLFVIAFYTTDIAVSVGPESFAGLPGAILGIAIPRLHTTWFATDVDVSQKPLPTMPSSGARTMGSQEFIHQIKRASMTWSGSAGRYLLWSVI